MSHGRAVAISSALRSPFSIDGARWRGSTLAELAAAVVREASLDAGLRPSLIDTAVLGVARIPPASVNPAREAVLRAGMTPRGVAHTVSAACASGEFAFIDGMLRIALGHADVVVVGGVDSSNEAYTKVPRAAVDALARLQRARAPRDKLRAIASLRPVEQADPPAELEGALSGWTSGLAVEKLAMRAGISRLEQDRWAARSHTRAARAAARVTAQVRPVPASDGPDVVVIDSDDGPRADASIATLADFGPNHDRSLGTVTSGNTARAATGAAASILVSEERARAEGWPVLARIRAHAATAEDPFETPFGGFATALPRALDRAGVALEHVDVVEMHEPYAAVVLATLERWASRAWASSQGVDAVGELDPERVNAWGGSIAYGHPAGASGGRMLATALARLRESDGTLAALVSGSVGGQGCAIVLERC